MSEDQDRLKRLAQMPKLLARMDEETIPLGDSAWGLWTEFTTRGKNNPAVCDVMLFHEHPEEDKPWGTCLLIDKEDFLKGNFPKYRCIICGRNVPTLVVQRMLVKQAGYRGYDPRTDRRAAVLATREKKRKLDV